MKQYFLNMFEYDIWANRRVYDSILNTVNIDKKAIALLSHIAAAQKIWLSRLTGKGDNPMHPWDPFIFEELFPFILQLNENWQIYLNDLEEEKMYSSIRYKNSQGLPLTSIVADIIIHVINHSTYHRAQIAAIVKASGGIPAITDYVVFKR